MQCAENFRQPLQVMVIRGGLRRRLPPVLRGRVAGFSGGGRRLRQASNIRGSKNKKNACPDHHRQGADFTSTMAPERNLIGNLGHNSRIYDRAASATCLREKSSNERERYANGKGAELNVNWSSRVAAALAEETKDQGK